MKLFSIRAGCLNGSLIKTTNIRASLSVDGGAPEDSLLTRVDEKGAKHLEIMRLEGKRKLKTAKFMFMAVVGRNIKSECLFEVLTLMLTVVSHR